MKFQAPDDEKKLFVGSYEDMWYYLRNEAFKQL